MKNQVIRAVLKTGNGYSFRIRPRVSLRSQDYAYRRFLTPLNVGLCQSSFRNRKEDLKQITLESWKNDLCLGIAEACVKFNGLRFAVR
ncbi:hypothetical protein D3C73_1422670 [compost metagenome]